MNMLINVVRKIFGHVHIYTQAHQKQHNIFNLIILLWNRHVWNVLKEFVSVSYLTGIKFEFTGAVLYSVEILIFYVLHPLLNYKALVP